jgi:cytochrome c
VHFFGRTVIVSLLASPVALVFAEGNIAAGKTAFRLCVQCHQVGPSARSGFAPQLNGIIGRPAAAAGDYKYSKAMQQSGIVWTEDKLRAFLRDPGEVVPGTSMRFWGIGDQQKITDLLAYLRSFPAQSAR